MAPPVATMTARDPEPRHCAGTFAREEREVVSRRTQAHETRAYTSRSDTSHAFGTAYGGCLRTCRRRARWLAKQSGTHADRGVTDGYHPSSSRARSHNTDNIPRLLFPFASARNALAISSEAPVTARTCARAAGSMLPAQAASKCQQQAVTQQAAVLTLTTVYCATGPRQLQPGTTTQADTRTQNCGPVQDLWLLQQEVLEDSVWQRRSLGASVV